MPGFLDALVDAESVLHNSDSDFLFTTNSNGSNFVNSTCLPFSCQEYNPFPNSQHYSPNPLYMEENSSSNSSNEQQERGRLDETPASSVSCFLLESASLTSSMSMDEGGKALPEQPHHFPVSKKPIVLGIDGMYSVSMNQQYHPITIPSTIHPLLLPHPFNPSSQFPGK